MRTILLLTVLLLVTVSAFVSDNVIAQRVEAYVSEDTVSVGDRFTLTLVALHGFDEIPSFPSLDSTFGDIKPIDLLSAGTRQIDSDTRLDSAVYEVTTFALDTAQLAPITIGFSNHSILASTDPQNIFVNSLVEQDAETIREMAPPVDFGRPLWPFALLGLAAIVIGFLVWYFIRKKRQSKSTALPAPEVDDSPSPSAVALERLRALEHTPLTTRSQIEAFYVELSDTLRTYVEHRLHIPALESTTQELIQSLIHPKIQHQVPSGIPQQLDQILSLSDLVKFADVTPSIPEGRHALEESFTVIKRVEVKFDQLEASEKLVPTD